MRIPPRAFVRLEEAVLAASEINNEVLGPLPAGALGRDDEVNDSNTEGTP